MSLPREVRTQAEILQAELMGMLLSLSDRPGFEASEGAVALRESLAALALFLGGTTLDDGSLEQLGKARASLDRAAGLIRDEESVASLGDAIEFLSELRAKAIDSLVHGVQAGRGAAEPAIPFALSLGAPALHRGLPIALPRLIAKDDEDRLSIDDEEPAGETSAPPAALASVPLTDRDPAERRQIEAHARDIMEDLSAFASLRRLHDDEAWSNADGFERRLLASFDALLALACPRDPEAPRIDLASTLFAYATEWVVPDKGRTFTFAFTLSCVTPDSGLLWVMMGLRRADPRVHESYVDALTLGSNPNTLQALTNLISADTPPDILLVALEVARRRRFFAPGMMVPMIFHPDPRITAAIARCLPFAAAATRDQTLDACLKDARPLVRVTAATVLLQLGTQSAIETIVEGLVQALSDKDTLAIRAALRGFALCGHAPSADLVWAGAEAIEHYRELGFFGHVGHVERLFGLLARLEAQIAEQAGAEQTARADSAAAAIARICGIQPPRLPSGRFDLETFKAMWAKRAPSLPRGRLRFGEILEPRAVLRELMAPKTGQADRRILADELALLGRGKFGFDVDGWLSDQRAFLAMVEDAWDRGI